MDDDIFRLLRDVNVQEEILSKIRHGSFEKVAVGSMGIAPTVFVMALRRNEFRDFAQRVEIARATARDMVEQMVMMVDPKFWLTHGPGKERLSLDGRTVIEGWGQHNKMDVSTKAPPEPPEYDPSVLSDEELAQFETLLARMTIGSAD